MPSWRPRVAPSCSGFGDTHTRFHHDLSCLEVACDLRYIAADYDAGRSSDLVRAGTSRTFAWWRLHYGALPTAPLRTEIDPGRVRSTNPGYCFRLAGWRRIGMTLGGHGRAALVILEAPPDVHA